ncbi:MAG: hypothetical protein QM564_13495 [Bergeyella sp.]
MKQLIELLKNVAIKKAQVNHALTQYVKMMKLTGLNYEKETDDLLDQLGELEKQEKIILELIKKLKKQ